MSLSPFPAARRLTLPPGVLPIALGLLLLLGSGPNMDLAVLSVSVLLTGSLLLWRPGEAPVLFLAFALGWLGASVITFYGNWLDRDVAFFAPFGGDVHQAVSLSLIGLLFVALGMRLGRGQIRRDTTYASVATAHAMPPATWFNVWLISYVLANSAGIFGSFLPDAAWQIVLGFVNLKWAFYFILAYVSFLQRSAKRLWFAFAIELASGIGGFFSDFKIVILVTMIAFAASGSRLSARALGLIAGLGAIALALGVIWTAIKGEYRTYIRGSSEGQVVTVDYADRMIKLGSLVAALDETKLGNGFDELIRRLTYVEFFAATLGHVPQFEPHGNGEILLDALLRPFTPRILFPDKAVVDDTARTNKYTGGLAGSDGNTSISLGYVAEAYIDFGWPGMLAWLFFIGIIYGSINRLMLSQFPPLLGNGLATAILLSVGGLDQSFTKVFGGLVATMIAAWILGRYVVPAWLPQLKPAAR